MIAMRILRPLIAAIGVAALTIGLSPVAAQAQAKAEPTIPTLVSVRAAHHPGLDRLVFEFRGGLPGTRTARYVTTLIADGSGQPVHVVGDAKLELRFFSANGHNDDGDVTFGATRRTFALPGIIEVVRTGDFEAVLSFGVGIAKRAPFRMYTLTKPSRIVVDITTPYRTVQVKDYFLNSRNFNAGRLPYTTGVWRPVIPPKTARGALQRPFAGPTLAERAAGLRFVGSGATGVSKVTIKNGVARVYLTGSCASGGSTFTIANLIRPTLKRLPSIDYVKIYDAAGHTERPTGRSDSIPTCLEP